MSSSEKPHSFRISEVCWPKTDGGLRLPPPVFGQHTTEILMKTGFTEAEITALKQQEVVFGD